jgi:hypothetical protein
MESARLLEAALHRQMTPATLPNLVAVSRGLLLLIWVAIRIFIYRVGIAILRRRVSEHHRRR